jgi:hypothetical protein
MARCILKLLLGVYDLPEDDNTSGYLSNFLMASQCTPCYYFQFEGIQRNAIILRACANCGEMVGWKWKCSILCD